MYTKKFLLVFMVLFLAVCFNGISAPVEFDTAKSIAFNWLMRENINAGDRQMLSLLSHEVYQQDGYNIYYIINFHPEGWVMVSADDAVLPIIGFNRKGSASLEDMPENLRHFLLDHIRTIEYAKHYRISNEATIETWNRILKNDFETRGDIVVAPLLSAKWGQGEGFNAYCPEDASGPGGRALVGCVAVAMGQTLYYWEWPEEPVGSRRYNHSTYGELSINFSDYSYDYNEMHDIIPNLYTALLLYHMGVSVNMNYGPGGSGAFIDNALASLKQYFGYNADAQLIFRVNYSEDAWIDIIKEQLDHGIPVYYAGTDTTYGGHAFNCDGYRTDDFFHFNWGWTGYLDGWFEVGNLNPGDFSFSSNQMIIIDLVPSEMETVILAEDFDPVKDNLSKDRIPPGWEITDNIGNGQTWIIGFDSDNSGRFDATTGYYAYIDSDAYGSGNSQNSSLITPVMDLSDYPDGIQLLFTHLYYHISNSSGNILYSIDNGDTWVNKHTFSANTGLSHFILDIEEVGGHSEVRLKFNYQGSWGWYWYIDDIVVRGTYMGSDEYDVILTVKDDYGNPVENIDVLVWVFGSDPVEIVVPLTYTDENGQIEFSLPEGIYEYDIAFDDDCYEYFIDTFEVDGTSELVEVDPVLESKTTTVTIRVFHDFGDPFVGEGVFINIDDETFTGWTSDEAPLNSVVFELPCGTFNFTATPATLCYESEEESYTFTVGPTKEKNLIDINMISVPVPIMFEAQNTAGDPIEGASIFITEYGNNLIDDLILDMDCGEYSYILSHPCYESETGSFEIPEDGSPIVIVMESPFEYSILFNIEDNHGNPLDGATVSIDGDPVGNSTEGAFTIDLECGTYDWTVTLEGYEEDSGTIIVTDADTVNAILSIIEYSVTIVVNPDAITADADPSGAGDYVMGSEVGISVEMVAGYNFIGWTSVPEIDFDDETSLSTTFTMPADDVTITANYTPDAVERMVNFTVTDGTDPIENAQITIYQESSIIFDLEDFTDTTFPPAGWTRYEFGTVAFPPWARTTLSSNSEPASALASYTSSGTLDNWLIMPALEDLDDNAFLSFYHRGAFMTWYEYSGIWVSTGSGDPDDGEFVEIAELVGDLVDSATNFVWWPAVVSLEAFAGEDIYIAFVYQGFDAHNWYIDDVYLYNIAEISTIYTDINGMANIPLLEGDYIYSISHACYESIANQEFSVIDEDLDIDITMTAQEFSVVFNIEDGDGNPLDGAIVSINGIDSDPSVGGTVTLDFECGTYDWTVILEGYNDETGTVIVPDDDTVDIIMSMDIVGSVIFNITDGIDPIENAEINIIKISSPIFEDFTEETFPPAGWTRYELGAGTTPPWQRNTASFHSAPASAFAEYSPSSNLDNWLITPPIENLGDNALLSFYHRGAYMTWYEYSGIWVSTGSGDPDDGEFVEIAELVGDLVDSASTFWWTEGLVSLEAFAGEDIYIAFVYQGYDGHAWYIDDIHVYSIEEMGTIYTDINGVASIHLEEGDYIYSVSHVCYESIADQEFSVIDDEDLDIDIIMTALEFSVVFNIEDGDGNPLDGAIVSINGIDSDPSVGGTVTLDFECGTYDWTVTLEGYNEDTGTFTVPDEDTVDAVLTLIPVDEYTVTMEVDPAVITADADPSGAGDYEEGDIVSISVQAVAGYTFTGWTSVPAVSFDDASALSTTFAMPADDVIVIANYEEDEPDCDPIDTLPYFKAFDDDDDTPDCWLNIDQSGQGFYWEFRTRAGVDIGTDGNYAIIDSDAAGSGNDTAADLITPVFDLTNYENGIVISFIHYYRHLGNSTATLLYSIDNGATWEVIENWNASSGVGDDFSAVVEEVGGHSEVLFAWSYDDGGSWAWYWAVDHILIEEYIAPDEWTVTIEVDPETIEGDADPQGAGDYSEGDIVGISVQAVDGYNFTGWTSIPAVAFDDASSLSTTFVMPAENVVVIANYEEDDPDDGPDASISGDDITYSPVDPLPGDTVMITARVHNAGTEDITSGNAEFYYSIEPGIDLQLITIEAFGIIEPGDYLDITIPWNTDADMDPMIYIITIMLTEIMPEDINLDNNEAYIELALPVELAFFTAVGINNRANIRWRTLSENNNLGFNLYRLNVNSSSQVFMPVKLNDQLIPGQGTTSNPTDYNFTDFGINRFFDYIYILETVSVTGETTEYRTQMMRIGSREIIFQ